MDKFYAGIGSRKSPTSALEEMEDIGTYLALKKYTLRSGGAGGADIAFEAGCDVMSGAKEIYLPWAGFNDSTSKFYTYPAEYETIAKETYGSRWNSLSFGAKKLMTRNVAQILGLKNIPCRFVVCWTPDGCTHGKTRCRRTGGTGQAITLASSMDIPVFNLNCSKSVLDMEQYISWEL